MPQLRHAHSAVLIAESDDLVELAAVARAVGLERVTFDGVGPRFDTQDAVIAAENAAEDPETSVRFAWLAGHAADTVSAALDTDDSGMGPIELSGNPS